jgi:hypothetical protein
MAWKLSLMTAATPSSLANGRRAISSCAGMVHWLLFARSGQQQFAYLPESGRIHQSWFALSSRPHYYHFKHKVLIPVPMDYCVQMNWLKATAP